MKTKKYDAVYINLKEKKDRDEHMKKMLDFLGISYERFNAIKATSLNGVNISPTYLEATHVGEHQMLANIGLVQGHVKILESRKEEEGVLLILEDDVYITSKALKRVNKVMKETFKNREWDIIRPIPDGSEQTSPFFLGIWERLEKLQSEGKPAALNQISNLAYKHNVCTRYSKFYKKSFPENFAGQVHFTLINKTSIKKILKYIREDYLSPMDCMYSTHKLDSYVIKMPPTQLRQRYDKFVTSIGAGKGFDQKKADRIKIIYK